MFKTINYLLHEKNKPELDVELLANFNPFITIKSFSYYDNGRYCNYINDTLNLYSGIFKSGDDQFKFFDKVIPKLRRKKNEYIKKSKPETPKKSLPIPEFLSKREVDMYNLQCK